MTSAPCILVSECNSVELSRFLPELQLAFPALPDEVVASYVREASISFCDRTSIVQQVLPIDLQCGVREVLIEPLCGMRVVAFLALSSTKECSRYPEPEQGIHRFSPCCGASSARFVPPSILELDSSPSQDRENGLWVRVSVAPDRDACEVPYELYQRYHEAILAGVKAELYLLKGQEWFDPALAEKFERKFNNAVTAANVERLLKFSRGPVSMRQRYRTV